MQISHSIDSNGHNNNSDDKEKFFLLLGTRTLLVFLSGIFTSVVCFVEDLASPLRPHTHNWRCRRQAPGQVRWVTVCVRAEGGTARQSLIGPVLISPNSPPSLTTQGEGSVVGGWWGTGGPCILNEISRRVETPKRALLQCFFHSPFIAAKQQVKLRDLLFFGVLLLSSSSSRLFASVARSLLVLFYRPLRAT